MLTYLKQLLSSDLPFPSHGFLSFRLLLLFNKPTVNKNTIKFAIKLYPQAIKMR